MTFGPDSVEVGLSELKLHQPTPVEVDQALADRLHWLLIDMYRVNPHIQPEQKAKRDRIVILAMLWTEYLLRRGASRVRFPNSHHPCVEALLAEGNTFVNG